MIGLPLPSLFAWPSHCNWQHEFKFVVNEHWVTSDDYDAATNELGKNNVITVSKPVEKPEDKPKKKEWNAPWQQKAEAYTTTADEIKALKREKKTMTNVISELRKELDKAKSDMEAKDSDHAKIKMQLRALETQSTETKKELEDKLRESNQALLDAASELKQAASSQQQNEGPYQAALEKVAELTSELKESKCRVEALSKQVEELLAASANARSAMCSSCRRPVCGRVTPCRACRLLHPAPGPRSPATLARQALPHLGCSRCPPLSSPAPRLCSDVTTLGALKLQVGRLRAVT